LRLTFFDILHDLLQQGKGREEADLQLLCIRNTVLLGSNKVKQDLAGTVEFVELL